MSSHRRRSSPAAGVSPRLQDPSAEVRALRERLAEVLHDLHTPLASLSLLALPEPVEGAPEDDARRQLRRAVTTLRRQTQILRDHPLLRQEAPRMALVSCRVRSWWAELRPALEEISRARGVDLEWTPPAEDGRFSVDVQRLGCALEHFLAQKAWRSVRPGTLRVRVELGARQVLVEVEGREAATEPAPDRPSAALEFAFAVVEAHGGNVSEIVLPDGWRRWRIALPRDVSTDSSTGPDPLLVDQVPHRVLVVEDDQALRELLQDLLSIRHRVVACRDAAEALQSLQEGVPDLLVVDQGLPDGQGLDLAVQIRRLSGHPIPLLLVTGATTLDALDRLENMRILTKPFRGSELLARSDEMLRTAAGEGSDPGQSDE